MLIPAPNADWWNFLQAVCLLPIAMAGGFPCCCAEPPVSGSTSSQPPIPPPGSTSTSTVTSPLPPRRSSSVGNIVRFECSGCLAGQTLLADQWQIEIRGVVGDSCPCAGVDGAYILDSVTAGGYAEGGGVEDIGCGQEFALSGFDAGGGGACPDTNVYLWFLAAGWRRYTIYTPDRYFALTKVIANLRYISGAPYIHNLHYEKWWDGNPNVDLTTGYTAGTGQVPCETTLNGTELDYTYRTGIGGGFTRCAVSGTCTIFEVEGF